jgi:hypothetical protein
MTIAASRKLARWEAPSTASAQAARVGLIPKYRNQRRCVDDHLGNPFSS